MASPRRAKIQSLPLSKFISRKTAKSSVLGVFIAFFIGCEGKDSQNAHAALMA
jgi:hypothetical protein